MPDENPDRFRYFIVTSGRSGSSLFSVILADAGADFGMKAPIDWDPQTGHMENKKLKKAAHHYRKMHDIEGGCGFLVSPRVEAHYRRRLGKKYLRGALEEAQYLKGGDLDLLIQPAFSLGYIPRLLLIYRQFEETAASMSVGRKHIGPDQAATDYIRIYRQSLVLMHCFGGCVVNYRDILNHGKGEWIEAVSGVTGLKKADMESSLQRRMKLQQEAVEYPVVYREAYRLFREMEALRGKVFRPARQVIRAMSKRESNDKGSSVN